MILPPKLPTPLQKLLDTLSWLLDARHSELLQPLFLGILFAHGRRTATAWFRSGGIAEHFRRAYTLLGSIGRDKTDVFASILFGHLRRGIVYLNGAPYVFCAFTTHLADLDDGERFIRAASKLTYQAFASELSAEGR